MSAVRSADCDRVFHVRELVGPDSETRGTATRRRVGEELNCSLRAKLERCLVLADAAARGRGHHDEHSFRATASRCISKNFAIGDLPDEVCSAHLHWFKGVSQGNHWTLPVAISMTNFAEELRTLK